MRLGVDARELSGKPTGVGRYLGGLLREWTADAAVHRHEIVLYSHRVLDGMDLRSRQRTLPGNGGTLWEQGTLRSAIAADHVDVLFSPAYSTPLFSSVPRVVALHDISFATRPEWFTWREGLRRRLIARRSASVASAVVTISRFSKSEIVSTFGTPPQKVHVIPPGIDSPCMPPDAQSVQPTDVLFVGSIFNRRHIPELIAAFASLAARWPDVSLHIVGDNRSHPHQDIGALIAATPAKGRIQWHRYVSEPRLRDLYARARVFVFLSEYEGLGLTPLEALACGVPSLLLDTPVARESCGASASYVSLDSIDRVAAALDQLLGDAPFRETLLATAPETLSRYSWKTAAQDTMRVLESVV